MPNFRRNLLWRQFLRGVATALITPMNEDGSVNLSKIDEIVEEQIEGGVAAIVSCGTTGEGSTLSRDEHVEVMRHTIKAVNRRIPVIAGTGSNDTAFCRRAFQRGRGNGCRRSAACFCLIITKASQKVLSSTTPIGPSQYSDNSLQCSLSRTARILPCETYKVLSAHKTSWPLREANGDISSVAHTVSLCGDSLDIYSGNDDQVIPMISLGGKGVISVFFKLCSQNHVGNNRSCS